MEAKVVRSWLCFLAILFIFDSLLMISANKSIVKLISDRKSFDEVTLNPSGAVVHFSGSDIKHRPEILKFAVEFGKAAEALKDHAIKFYKVDCNAKALDFEKECHGRKDYVSVYTVNNKWDLEISALFDEDHIVGHILMNILEHDVTIAQDKYLWDEALTNSRGSRDIVLGYFKGIGEKEHRVFLEAAFVYGKEYLFVVTTDKTMPGVKEDGSLWYYKCKSAAAEAECEYRVRKMPPSTVLDVVGFIKLDGLSRIVEIEQDGTSIYDKLDLNFPINKVYLFSNDLKALTKIAAEVLKSVDDSFYFVLVDVKTRFDLLPEFGVNLATDWDATPGTLVLQPAHLVGSDQKYYEQYPKFAKFDSTGIIRTLNHLHKSPNNAYKELAADINVQFATIKDWVRPTKGIVVVGGCMDGHPGCQEFYITFRRIARSIYYTNLDVDVKIFYVDFTDQNEDAKLNTLPGFEIYKNGNEIKHIGQMDYESLLQFLWTNLSPNVRRLPLSGSDHLLLEPEEIFEDEKNDDDDANDDDSESLLLKEDDSMGKYAVDVIKRGIKDEDVTTLKDKTFYSTMEANELMVTLFYLPWCVKSIILREAYAKVAAKFPVAENADDVKTVVNKINCFDWEDVCKKENVTAYPTIKIYRKGHGPITYTESLDVKTLENSIRMYQTPVAREILDSASIDKYMDLSQPSEFPVSVLGLFKAKSGKEYKAFQKSAKELFGKFPFAFAVGDIAGKSKVAKRFQLPLFLLVKRNDDVETFSATSVFTRVNKFIEENSLPTYGELMALNFPKYRKFQKPLLIQFKERDDTINKVPLQQLAHKTERIFVAWMDMSRNITKEILRAYIKDVSKPALVLVNHEKGKVYQFKDVVSNDSLVKWVKGCLKGKIKPVAELKNVEWKPLRKPYDYLSMQETKEADFTKEQDVASVDVGDGQEEANVAPEGDVEEDDDAMGLDRMPDVEKRKNDVDFGHDEL